MKSFHPSIQLTGTVVSLSLENGSFIIEPLTKESIVIQTSITTNYGVLKNIGDESRARVSDSKDEEVEKLIGKEDNAVSKEEWRSKRDLIKYIKKGVLVSIKGIYSEHDKIQFYLARRAVLMPSNLKEYGWEEAHWWIQQDNTLFEQRLDVLFGSKREITESDIAEFYRTNLNMLGGVTLSSIQDSAALSRFLYGLSSAYLLTGNERAFSAAKACVRYIVNAYSNGNHDNRCIFWKFGREQDAKSTREILGSRNPEDRGTHALYEQIYVLSGLTQYYRIIQDTYILSFITRTIAAFEGYFRDAKENGIDYNDETKTNNDTCYLGSGRYFSHIDTLTMRPDSPSLGANAKRKNWNSIGDHLPPYLVNLLVSIDPIPVSAQPSEWIKLLESCRNIPQDCVENILKYFPREVDEKGEPTTLFVNERFKHDWTPDHFWGWQQDRGIVGHNLKISWNLTRCEHYFNRRVEEIEKSNEKDKEEKAKELRDLKDKCYQFSFRLDKNSEGHQYNFVLHYRANINSEIKTLNVMPDFVRPGDLKIIGYTINGVSYEVEGLNQYIFQIPISNLTENSVVTVEYLPIRPTAKKSEELESERKFVEVFQIPFTKQRS